MKGAFLIETLQTEYLAGTSFFGAIISLKIIENTLQALLSVYDGVFLAFAIAVEEYGRDRQIDKEGLDQLAGLNLFPNESPLEFGDGDFIFFHF